MLLAIVAAACKPDPNLDNHFPHLGINTKHVFLIIMDGARYSETEGDISHSNIEQIHTYFAANGCIGTKHYNKGKTLTNPGHATMCTGEYQQIDNAGEMLPSLPSIFQYYNKTYPGNTNKTWVVASKDKLEVLGNTSYDSFHNQHQPNTNCGNSGSSSGYRADTTTLRIAKNIALQHQPNLMLLQFKEPDPTGHSGNWQAYLNQIKTTDSLIMNFINYINTLPNFRDSTAFIVTNDHGRHLDSVATGFTSHGDSCEGCQHIMLYASGPDFKKSSIINTPYQQPDIATTIASLLNFGMPTSRGSLMLDLFAR
jgi:hypothetical protein